MFLVLLNTFFLNKRGIGKKLNDLTQWLWIFKLLNILMLTYFILSFEGNVCFCKGRYHFYKYCNFIDPADEPDDP